MRVFCLTLAALAAAASGFSTQSAEITTLRLGTATPGGGFSVYGQALAAAVREADPSLEIKAQQTSGSMENVPLLEVGELDLGLVEGTAAYEALTGIGRAPAQLFIVAAMYASPGMFAVRADSAYRRIEDLQGTSVVFGAAGSGFVLLARYVLDGLGLDMQRDFDAMLLKSTKDGPPMVLGGKAAAMWGGGIGWPAFETIALGPAGARFIAPRPDQIARIQAKHPFLRRLTLPARTYPGQDQAIDTVGSWSVILARPGLADDDAYQFARALHRAQPGFGTRLEQAKHSTPENTLAAAPREDMLHPGVMRYLRSISVLK